MKDQETRKGGRAWMLVGAPLTRYQQQIEAKWPKLEARGKRAIVTLVALEVLALVVYFTIKHHAQ